MKLALAVGDKRHYVVDEVMPRHFVQTAAKSGIPESVVQGIFEELSEIEKEAVLKVLEELQPDFPEDLVRSIVEGLRRRLRLLRRVAA